MRPNRWGTWPGRPGFGGPNRRSVSAMKALGKTPPGGGTLQPLGFLALALILGLAAARGAWEGGELTPPLDDTFIYLQYARTGSPVEYQPGAAPTRGATSLLYPLLLAPLAARLYPQGAVWLAFALGVALLAATAWAAARWAERVVGPRAGWAAGGLSLLSGHLVWGSVSGMDIALFAFAITATVSAAAWYLDAAGPASGLRRMSGLAAVLLLLSLARPEGMGLAGITAAAVIASARAPNSRRARGALLLAPFAGILVTAGVTLVSLGHLRTNTLEAKAVWSEQRPDVLAGVLSRLPEVLGKITYALFSDFGSAAYGHRTGFLLPAMLGGGAVLAAAGAVRSRWAAPPRMVWLLLAVGLLTGLIPVGWNAHYNRYQIPYVPLAVLLAVYGWARAVRKPSARWAVWALLALLLLPGLRRHLLLYGRNAADIREQQVATGRWIDAHLPEDAVVAINDAGALAYFGNRRVVDLVGLVTNGSALPNRAGPASLYEWLERLAPEERPTHFAIFPNWFPYLRRTSLVGAKLAQFHLANRSISGADLKAVYRADWGNVGRGGLPVARRPLLELWGFSVIDDLDVAHLESEAAHAYEAFPTWRSTLREFPTADPSGDLLIDGGRQPGAGERFVMRCLPGRPGALILRTEAYVPVRLEVSVDGTRVGELAAERAPLVWSEPVLDLPADVLAAETVTFRVVSQDTTYASYHYWLIQ